MGRFNWMLRVIRKASAVVCVVGLPVSALGFTSDDDVVQMRKMGDCSVSQRVVTKDKVADVYVFPGVDPTAEGWDPKGYYYSPIGFVFTSELTATVIEFCLKTNPGAVINYSGVAATPSRLFSEQKTMGFTFTLSNTATTNDENYQAGGTYSFYIGALPDVTAPSVTISPAGGATGVSSSSNITLDFDETVRNIDDSALTDANVDALITLKNTDAYGTDIPFDATISGNVITINPTTDLSSAQMVYVAIGATVEDAADNAITPASATFTAVGVSSPASAFEEAETEIQAIITQDATRSLNSTLSSNQRMTRGARSRFIESRSKDEGDGAGFATRNNVPFDVDGTFDLDGARLSSKGTFFGQTGNVEGTERRLVFGEFDVQRDGDTGSTTATLTGRVAWEQMISDDTMLGYFVGGELAESNISGAFEGKQTRVAATAGGYAVHALSETLFADGFISIGAGRNNLEMADDVLALTSDYTTRTATVGGALTGVYAYERYELRPEVAFSYGKTWIGDVGFTGVAYGLTDNTLSVDAGTVSTASLTLRPEIVFGLDADTVAESHAQLSFAPSFICERTMATTTSKNCGAGAEIGLSSTSEDGLSSANVRFVVDRVGNSNRSNVLFNVEHRF